jgi:rRNA processing protein Gar1
MFSGESSLQHAFLLIGSLYCQKPKFYIRNRALFYLPIFIHNFKFMFFYSQVKELGYFTHPCQDDLVCKCTLEDVPYFNAPIYLENKQQIGKVDEIFGSLKDYSISVKLSEDVKAKSFAANQKVLLSTNM